MLGNACVGDPRSAKGAGFGTRVQNAQDDLQELYEEVRQYAAPINLKRIQCDLREIWRDAWQNLSQCHEEKRLCLREDLQGVDWRIHADPFAICQVFRNIFENAIAVSPESGVVAIRAGATECNGQSAVAIEIEDAGPGLTDEDLQRIFEPFFTTKAKGTGLGMAIAQRIVHSHSGRISAENATVGGANLKLILPKELS